MTDETIHAQLWANIKKKAKREGKTTVEEAAKESVTEIVDYLIDKVDDYEKFVQLISAALDYGYKHYLA